jgi:hypothetical protein
LVGGARSRPGSSGGGRGWGLWVGGETRGEEREVTFGVTGVDWFLFLFFEKN